MASNIKIKLGGVVHTITSLNENDLLKVQGAIDQANTNKVDIASLQTAVAESNQLQHVIASSDLGAAGATIEGLTSGVLYDVYYNKAGRYLTYDETTGTFADQGVPESETADNVPATLKVFPATSATTVASPRIYEMTSSFDGFVKIDGAQTVAGLKTFTQTPQVTAEQDISTLGNNDAVKGAVVKGVDTRLQTAEGKITALESNTAAKLSAQVVASEPADEGMTEGVLYLWTASNVLTSAE